MRLKRLEGASSLEALTTMLLLLCLTLLGLVFMYIVQPDIFTPMTNVLGAYFNSVMNYFK